MNINNFFEYYSKYNFTYKGDLIDWKSKLFEWDKKEIRPKNSFIKTTEHCEKLQSWEIEFINQLEKSV